MSDSAGSSITCPQCGMTSYHPQDVANGYCGNCHDFTGLSPEVLAEARELAMVTAFSFRDWRAALGRLAGHPARETVARIACDMAALTGQAPAGVIAELVGTDDNPGPLHPAMLARDPAAPAPEEPPL